MDLTGAIDLLPDRKDLSAEVLGISNELHAEAQHERRLVGNAVSPDGLKIAFNREMRRAEKKLARRLPKEVEPIDLRKRNPAKNKAEAIERVIKLLLEGQPHLFDGTVETMSQFLTTYEGKILREANARGLPLPIEYIRSALMQIHAEGERKRAEAKARAAAFGS